MARAEHVLIIFTRSPVAGAVKTRLIPTLGPVNAMRLYVQLAAATFRTAAEAGFDSVQVWLTENAPGNRHLEHWKQAYHFEYHLQQGAGLGERMYYAFDQALSTFRIAVLIGCDCPVLTKTDLICAREKLYGAKRAGVLGPAEDGGYYLLGLNTTHPSLFKDILWGESDVAKRTREQAARLRVSLYELEPKWDVDTVDDVNRLAARWSGLSANTLH